jgi:hypothetical protein
LLNAVMYCTTSLYSPSWISPEIAEFLPRLDELSAVPEGGHRTDRLPVHRDRPAVQRQHPVLGDHDLVLAGRDPGEYVDQATAAIKLLERASRTAGGQRQRS